MTDARMREAAHCDRCGQLRVETTKCPRCEVGHLVYGYGLAGGGIGSYQFCCRDECEHFVKQLDEVEE